MPLNPSMGLPSCAELQLAGAHALHRFHSWGWLYRLVAVGGSHAGAERRLEAAPSRRHARGLSSEA